jgi:putative DNA primase/helicase
MAKIHALPAAAPDIIRHDPGSLHHAADAVLALLVRRECGLYRHGETLKRMHRLTEKTSSEGISRDAGSIMLVLVEALHMAELAGQAGLHTKYDGRTKTDRVIDCPHRVCATILARQHWPEVPRLHAVIGHPTIDPDGRILADPGYDRQTGIYLATEHSLPPRKTGKLGRAAVQEAYSHLVEHFGSFAFRAKTDRDAFLALLLTGLVRPFLPAAPMGAISSPAPGTGKTLAAECIGVTLTGCRPSVMAIGKDEAETEKRIGGALMAGDPFLLVDNINRPVGAEDLLNQLATSPSVRIRPLGGSGLVTVPTTATVVLTGNNLSIIGDLKRRVLPITLDAGVERPEERAFPRDILADTLARRWDLIAAAITIIGGYIAAGRPTVDAKPYGSFGVWDQMVRRPLIWAGADDPLAGVEQLRSGDPDLEEMRLLFASWYAEFSDSATTTAKVIEVGMRASFGGVYDRPELHDALNLACSEKINGRRLGGWLRRHRDRIIDGMQLRQVDAAGSLNVSKWRIARV